MKLFVIAVHGIDADGENVGGFLSMGSVIGDLNSRRCIIQEMGNRGAVKYVKALAPLAEMFGFASAIRSLSQGRAVPSPMEFHSYKEVPSNIARAIVEGERK